MREPYSATRGLVTLLAVLSALVSFGAAGRDVSILTAVRQGDPAAVRALIDRKADVNAVDVDGTTALHWAAHRDSLDMVDLLIGAGANARAANRYGVTPIALLPVDLVCSLVAYSAASLTLSTASPAIALARSTNVSRASPIRRCSGSVSGMAMPTATPAASATAPAASGLVRIMFSTR